jgi:hypothetical protein
LGDEKLFVTVGVMSPQTAFRDISLHIEGEKLFSFCIFDNRLEPAQEFDIGAFAGQRGSIR